jgi:hypothetical protein
MKRSVWVLASSAILSLQSAAAYDQQVSSTLYAEGYSVYSREGIILSRRRIVDDLTLGAWNLLPNEDDPYYEGPRLSVDVSLRLSTDAAISRAEVSTEDINGFVPGLTPVAMDAMVAYVDASGLWGDTLDLRAGRQMRLDTLGFFAFDGVDTRLRLPIGLALGTYLGLEVRGGHMLGYDALELDGTDRGGRRGLAADQFPDREAPGPRLAMGTEVVIHPVYWLEMAAAYRAVGVNDGAGALADERVGGRALLDFSPVQTSGRVVYSPLVNKLSEADAEVGVTPVRLVTLLVDYHRYVPVFEGDAIFNVFDLSPQNDVGGRMVLHLTETIDAATWGFGRLVPGSAGLDGTEQDALFSGAGGGVGGNYRTPSRALSLRLNYLKEWGEARVGAELGGGHGFFRNSRLWLAFRLSFWHIEDHFSEMYSGNTAGYVLSARFKLSHRAHVLGEFEHYVGEGRDKRFYALALLQLDLWR